VQYRFENLKLETSAALNYSLVLFRVKQSRSGTGLRWSRLLLCLLCKAWLRWPCIVLGLLYSEIGSSNPEYSSASFCVTMWSLPFIWLGLIKTLQVAKVVRPVLRSGPHRFYDPSSWWIICNHMKRSELFFFLKYLVMKRNVFGSTVKYGFE
jgi:hypothetical protein